MNYPPDCFVAGLLVNLASNKCFFCKTCTTPQFRSLYVNKYKVIVCNACGMRAKNIKNICKRCLSVKLFKNKQRLCPFCKNDE